MRFGVSIRQAPDSFINQAIQSECLDFVEIAAEEFAFRRDWRPKDRLERILSAKPVAVHGYSLSLGDPNPWNESTISSLFGFLVAHPFLNFSDHLAISSWRGRALGSLTPAPGGALGAETVNRKILDLQSRISGVPFFVENAASPFRLAEPNAPSARTLVEAIRGTQARVLLDISNLVANEINFGMNAEAELEVLLQASVGEVHLSGGHFENGFYRDSHATEVGARSWELYEKALQRLPDDVLVLIEREQNHPDWKVLEGEVRYARSVSGF